MNKYRYIFPFLLIILFFMNNKTLAESGMIPSIELIGSATIYLERGTEYQELGVTAYDNEDGDLTTEIQISSSLNINRVGTYKITYSVTDSDNNTATVERQIQVYDFIYDENSVLLKYYFEDNSMQETSIITDIVPDSDGGFIAVGQFLTNEYLEPESRGYATIAKINNFGEIKWARTEIIGSTQYHGVSDESNHKLKVSKVIKTQDNNYLVIATNYFKYISALIKFDENFSEVSRAEFNFPGYYIDIVEYQENKYAVLDNGSNLRLFDNLDATDIKSNFGPIDNITLLSEGKIVAYDNKDYGVEVKLIDLLDHYGAKVCWSEVINDINLIDIFVYNNEIILVGNTINEDPNLMDGVVVSLGTNGAVLTNKNFGGNKKDEFRSADLVDNKLFIQTRSVSEDGDLILAPFYGAAIIDLNTMEVASNTSFSSMFIPNVISGNSEGCIAIGGNHLYSGYSQKLTVLCPKLNFTKFADSKLKYDEEFTPDYDIEIINNYGEALSYEVHSVDREIDTKVVGYHDLIYYLTVTDGTDVYPMELKRTLIVEPSLDNGGIYYQALTPNLGGASATLDGITYQEGTLISEIGNHTMKITGANGYEADFLFTITSSLSDGEVFEDYFQADFTAPTVYLDGELYQNEKITEIGNHVLEIHGVGDYIETISFQIIPSLSNDETVRAPFEPNINAEMYLNGEPYNNDMITEIGYQTLEIYGSGDYYQTINFLVIADIPNNQTYHNSYMPQINAPLLELNGEVYNNEIITEAGEYELKITGRGDFIQIINFQIIPKYHVFKDDIYKAGVIPVEIGVSATYRINGEAYKPGATFYQIGNHLLEVTSLNGYTETIPFTITVKDLAEIYNYVFNLELPAELDIDGEEYISGSNYYKVGHHVLTIRGTNDYITTNAFTITEKALHIENNQIYINTVTPVITYADLLLDGKVYESGTAITELGNHVLTVKGSNDYLSEYHFTIDFETPGLEDQGVYLYPIYPTFTEGNATLNGKPYESGTKIAEVGNHVLCITTENGYTKTLSFQIIPDIENKQIFYQAYTPNINAYQMSLNGKPYNNELIEAIGNYVLVINGTGGYTQTLNFQILPKLQIADKAVFYGTTTINIPNALLKLNGEDYISGTKITTIGNHRLEIIGVSGYKAIIEFVITPEINVINNEKYNKGFIIDVENHLKLDLNGDIYEAGEKINRAGNYTLTVYGINDYQKTYNFVILGDLNIEAGGVYTGDVTPEIDNGEILIDGTPHKVGTKYAVVGHHELTILGVNDYKYTLSFTIAPVVTGVENGKDYEGEVHYQVENAVVKLNGESAPNSGIITSVGHHTITITGTNDYEVSISFTLNPIITGLKDKAVYYDKLIINIPNSKLSIDGKIYKNGTPYEKIGKHKLTITGENGYQQEIEFTLKYSNKVITEQIIIIAIPVLMISGLTFIAIKLRRKVV